MIPGLSVDDSPRLVAQRRLIESLFGQTAHRPGADPVQRRKTVEPTEGTKHDWWIKQYTETSFVPTNLVKDTDPPALKAKAIWDKGVSIYNTNADRGAKLELALDAAVKNFKTDIQGGIDPAERHRAKNQERDSTFTNQYESTEPDPVGNGTYRVNSAGFDTVRPTVSKEAHKGDYSNVFDVLGGNIKAEWNMAGYVDKKDWSVRTRDKARAANKGLQNSDILWRQARSAAMHHFKGDNEQEKKANEALAGITRIQRDNIINGETVLTVFMAYPDDVAWNSERTFQPGTSEFQAILGSPNASSSAYFLIDNIALLKKTYRDIKATASGGLDINFQAIA